MTDHSNIDDRFRHRQGDWEGQPSDAAWNRLTDRLDEFEHRRVGRRRTVFRIAAAASLTILLGLSFAMFNQSMDAAGSQAVNTDEEMPDHQGVFAPVSTSDFDESPPMTSSTYSPDEVVETTIDRFESPQDEAVLSGERSTSMENEAFSKANKALSVPAEQSSIAAKAMAENVEMDKAVIEHTAGGMAVDQALQGGTMEDDDYKTEEEFAFSGDAEIEEPEMLTETAVANAIGIEQQKNAHKKKIKPRNSEPRSLDSVAEYENSGDRAEHFVNRSLMILIPNEDRNRCTYTALLVDEDKFYIDRCQTDAFDLILNESLPLDHAVLIELMEADVEHMLQIEKQNDSADCNQNRTDLKLIYRYGTDLSYFDETITLSSDSNCLTSEARDIVVRLNKLLKELD